MHKTRLSTGLILLSVIICNCNQKPGPFLQDSGQAGLLVIEAEHFDCQLNQGFMKDSTQYEFRIIEVDSASNGRAVILYPPEPPANVSDTLEAKKVSPTLKYKAQFTKQGRHWIWSRGRANAETSLTVGKHDSFHLSVDGKIGPRGSRVDYGAISRMWWTNWQVHGQRPIDRRYIDIPAPGEHEISIYMRESGTIIDKICLTTDSTWTPPDSFGVAPFESPRMK